MTSQPVVRLMPRMENGIDTGRIREKEFMAYRFDPPDTTIRWNGIPAEELSASPDFQENGNDQINTFVLGQDADQHAALPQELIELYQVLLREPRAWTEDELLAELNQAPTDRLLNDTPKIRRGLRWMQRQWFPILQADGRWNAVLAAPRHINSVTDISMERRGDYSSEAIRARVYMALEKRGLTWADIENRFPGPRGSAIHNLVRNLGNGQLIVGEGGDRTEEVLRTLDHLSPILGKQASWLFIGYDPEEWETEVYDHLPEMTISQRVRALRHLSWQSYEQVLATGEFTLSPRALRFLEEEETDILQNLTAWSHLFRVLPGLAKGLRLPKQDPFYLLVGRARATGWPTLSQGDRIKFSRLVQGETQGQLGAIQGLGVSAPTVAQWEGVKAVGADYREPLAAHFGYTEKDFFAPVEQVPAKMKAAPVLPLPLSTPLGLRAQLEEGYQKATGELENLEALNLADVEDWDRLQQRLQGIDTHLNDLYAASQGQLVRTFFAGPHAHLATRLSALRQRVNEERPQAEARIKDKANVALRRGWQAYHDGRWQDAIHSTEEAAALAGAESLRALATARLRQAENQNDEAFRVALQGLANILSQLGDTGALPAGNLETGLETALNRIAAQAGDRTAAHAEELVELLIVLAELAALRGFYDLAKHTLSVAKDLPQGAGDERIQLLESGILVLKYRTPVVLQRFKAVIADAGTPTLTATCFFAARIAKVGDQINTITEEAHRSTIHRTAGAIGQITVFLDRAEAAGGPAAMEIVLKMVRSGRSDEQLLAELETRFPTRAPKNPDAAQIRTQLVQIREEAATIKIPGQADRFEELRRDLEALRGKAAPLADNVLNAEFTAVAGTFDIVARLNTLASQTELLCARPPADLLDSSEHGAQILDLQSQLEQAESGFPSHLAGVSAELRARLERLMQEVDAEQARREKPYHDAIRDLTEAGDSTTLDHLEHEVLPALAEPLRSRPELAKAVEHARARIIEAEKRAKQLKDREALKNELSQKAGFQQAQLLNRSTGIALKEALEYVKAYRAGTLTMDELLDLVLPLDTPFAMIPGTSQSDRFTTLYQGWKAQADKASPEALEMAKEMDRLAGGSIPARELKHTLPALRILKEMVLNGDINPDEMGVDEFKETVKEELSDFFLKLGEDFARAHIPVFFNGAWRRNPALLERAHRLLEALHAQWIDLMIEGFYVGWKNPGELMAPWRAGYMAGRRAVWTAHSQLNRRKLKLLLQGKRSGLFAMAWTRRFHTASLESQSSTVRSFDGEEAESLQNSHGTLEEIQSQRRRSDKTHDADILLSEVRRSLSNDTKARLLTHLEEVAPIGNLKLRRKLWRQFKRETSTRARGAIAMAYFRLARNTIKAKTGRVFKLSFEDGAELNKAIQEHSRQIGTRAAHIEMDEPFEIRQLDYAVYSTEERRYIIYRVRQNGKEVVRQRITRLLDGSESKEEQPFLDAQIVAVDLRGNLSERVGDADFANAMDPGLPAGPALGFFAHTHIHFEIRSQDSGKVLDSRMGHIFELAANRGAVRVTELQGVRFLRHRDRVAPSEIDRAQREPEIAGPSRGFDPIRMIPWNGISSAANPPPRPLTEPGQGLVEAQELKDQPQKTVYFARLDNHEDAAQRLSELAQAESISAARISGIGAAFGGRLETAPGQSIDLTSYREYLATGDLRRAPDASGPSVRIHFKTGDEQAALQTGDVTRPAGQAPALGIANVALGEFYVEEEPKAAPASSQASGRSKMRRVRLRGGLAFDHRLLRITDTLFAIDRRYMLSGMKYWALSVLSGSASAGHPPAGPPVEYISIPKDKNTLRDLLRSYLKLVNTRWSLKDQNLWTRIHSRQGNVTVSMEVVRENVSQAAQLIEWARSHTAFEALVPETRELLIQMAQYLLDHHDLLGQVDRVKAKYPNSPDVWPEGLILVVMRELGDNFNDVLGIEDFTWQAAGLAEKSAEILQTLTRIRHVVRLTVDEQEGLRRAHEALTPLSDQDTDAGPAEDLEARVQSVKQLMAVLPRHTARLVYEISLRHTDEPAKLGELPKSLLGETVGTSALKAIGMAIKQDSFPRVEITTDIHETAQPLWPKLPVDDWNTVLENLIINALRATADRASPTLRFATGITQSAEGEWKDYLSLSGIGHGLPVTGSAPVPLVRPPIINGSGYLLETARDIVEKHGGSMTVETGPQGKTIALLFMTQPSPKQIDEYHTAHRAGLPKETRWDRQRALEEAFLETLESLRDDGNPKSILRTLAAAGAVALFLFGFSQAADMPEWLPMVAVAAGGLFFGMLLDLFGIAFGFIHRRLGYKPYPLLPEFENAADLSHQLWHIAENDGGRLTGAHKDLLRHMPPWIQKIYLIRETSGLQRSALGRLFSYLVYDSIVAWWAFTRHLLAPSAGFPSLRYGRVSA